MVTCPERGADLHMAKLMPLPLTVSCFSKLQIGFAFLLPAHLDGHRKGTVSVCVRGCMSVVITTIVFGFTLKCKLVGLQNQDERCY